jgi:signal transduction histidine kinase
MTANANRILLVDDDDLQRKLAKVYLESAGFLVDAATSAFEALTLAQVVHPDVIVSDVLMPDVDGYELCRQLKGDALLAAIPVVLMSSLSSQRADRERARRSGAAALVERSPTFEHELASVRSCLKDGSAHVDTCEDHRVHAELRATAAERRRQLDGLFVGGIAHDFNNMLTVILSGAYSLLDALAEGDRRYEDANAIKGAAERAAALAHQLLATSRHQVIDLSVVDLRRVVANLTDILRRLTGEEISLRIVGGAGLGSVRADPSQLDRVLVNLVINAREAMPEGGTLSIETSNVELEEGGEVPAGSYVMLAVTDTGTGMSAETRARVFEPFFTTKGSGKDTGLGLSTSHRIIKQIGGHICVTSVLGEGTVIELYLPRIADGNAARS